jgi:hypothetical protein
MINWIIASLIGLYFQHVGHWDGYQTIIVITLLTIMLNTRNRWN